MNSLIIAIKCYNNCNQKGNNKKGEKNKTLKEQGMHSTVAHILLGNAQPVPKHQLVARNQLHPSFRTGHDVL